MLKVTKQQIEITGTKEQFTFDLETIKDTFEQNEIENYKSFINKSGTQKVIRHFKFTNTFYIAVYISQQTKKIVGAYVCENYWTRKPFDIQMWETKLNTFTEIEEELWQIKH